jgi:hypothetical protein
MTFHRRRSTTAVALLLSGLLAAVVVALGPDDSAHATDVSSSQTAVSAHAAKISKTSFDKAMRALWEQHMQWTYATITAFATDSPTYPATVNRLLRNQGDIGNAIKPFYGKAAGNALTKLLKAHISGVATILVAAKAGDTSAFNTAVAKEYANAKQIGTFLANANPHHWSKMMMRTMMKTHIDQTLVYASDQLGGKYAASIRHYDSAEKHMLSMADMLAHGIEKQFPRRFR